ncbi:hypothetical protein QYE76_039116 [Lolium multiflorum]|uniref:CCHC-type domain-containing protein n=1 Tax=Lolium multiflorum TaxID=4521 RepID=A0AAD8TA92_LOLMU|nr:hypothetical protein QYE76_039116 [Lolium multiflorum]
MIPPTMEPNISRGDKDEDEYEEEDWVVSLRDKGKSVFKVLYKDKIACSHFFEILTTAIESQKLIWMHENTIDKKGALEREYADDVASLKNELEEEQTIKEALEETFALELSREKENHDRALEMANELKLKNDKLVFVNAKLLEDFEQLKKGSRVIESALTKLTESHEQLKASYLKEHANLPSPIAIDNDACATNSTSCEASTLKENVELRAQLDLLTSNYGKLEENHGKISSSHEDLLASHDRLKLAHEAIISKETPCEPHVDTSTTTQNAILPCASPSNSSTHNIAKSCDELSSLPCCSNNEDSTSSSTCVVTNHVEEIKELKAQVTSLKNDLVKGHEGKCKLDTMLSMQQSPNDKSGLGFKSNNKNKSKNNNKKKGQVQVKDPAKIVCFKCNIEGHHVRSCPLKKKQKGKRPQAQTHIQPQVEEIPLPKKKQANAPIVEKPSEKKEKKRTCYICREKGHISSLCTIGTSSNSITIDDVYSLRQHKDYLDACSEGSFTSKEVEARWDLLDRIEDNAEGWENDKGYADKPPFKTLPPKEGNEEKEEKKKKKGTKKKKKKENKKKEVTYPRVNEITLGNRKYVAPNDYCDNESEYDDLPMPFTYISNHDLNEHTTFDIANLWEINSENDDDNNCHSVSAIHASSHNDIESSKLGEEVFENPLATGHYVLDTSPSNNNDGVDTDKPTVKDNYSISYDDTVPPISDDYYKECYDIAHTWNSIRSLEVDGALVVSHTAKAAALFSFYDNLLGRRSDDAWDFDVAELYRECPKINGAALVGPFSAQEVADAVNSLDRSSALGHDGLGPSFYCTAWDVVQPGLLRLYEGVFSRSIDLERINMAHVVILPKVTGILTPISFRPVSLQNCSIKANCKALTFCLQQQIGTIIDVDQTGFLTGRSISKKFVSATELVHTCCRCRAPCIVLKLDSEKP